MDGKSFEQDLATIVEALAQVARDDAGFRGAMQRVIAALQDRLQAESPAMSGDDVVAAEPVPAPPADAEAAPLSDEKLSELIASGSLLPEGFKPVPGEMAPVPAMSSAPAAARPAPTNDVADGELPTVRKRCLIKAAGARWARKRRKLLNGGADFDADIAPGDEQVIRDARELPDCFLWMNRPESPQPSDPDWFDRLAACYENVASALELVMDVRAMEAEAPGVELKPALLLLAEAQSALRAAAAGVGYDRDDMDQAMVHRWLRRITREEQIFLERYMTRDNAANPADWGDLADRLDTLGAELGRSRDVAKKQKSGFTRIRYHLNRIQGDPTEDHSHDWDVINETVDDLIDTGLAPSNVELRELLLPEIDELPAGLELLQGTRLVMRELDTFVAHREGTPRPPARQVLASPEVQAVAEKLGGKQVFLIGGLRRRQSELALKEAFGLEEVVWFETREHESVSVFEPYIHRPEVAIVLLAIRWSSHAYGEVKAFCDQAGKPLVRLPAGYNPNQVAHQIMAQASDQL